LVRGLLRDGRPLVVLARLAALHTQIQVDASLFDDPSDSSLMGGGYDAPASMAVASFHILFERVPHPTKAVAHFEHVCKVTSTTSRRLAGSLCIRGFVDPLHVLPVRVAIRAVGCSDRQRRTSIIRACVTESKEGIGFPL
jgi:hypothetical protein